MIRLTKEFCEIANAATQELAKAVGMENVGHCIAMINWHGPGTFELHLVPKFTKVYHDKKSDYDRFWQALREHGLLMTEPVEGTCNTVDGTCFSVMAVIKGMPTNKLRVCKNVTHEER